MNTDIDIDIGYPWTWQPEPLDLPSLMAETIELWEAAAARYPSDPIPARVLAALREVTDVQSASEAKYGRRLKHWDPRKQTRRGY